MLYRFKSQATADLIMFSGDGDQVLRALGRNPSDRGTLTVDQLPDAIRALEAACASAEAALPAAADETTASDATAAGTIGFGVRAMPFVAMLKRALAAKVSVVWGV